MRAVALVAGLAISSQAQAQIQVGHTCLDDEGHTWPARSFSQGWECRSSDRDLTCDTVPRAPWCSPVPAVSVEMPEPFEVLTDLNDKDRVLARAYAICGAHIVQDHTLLGCLPTTRLCNAHYEWQECNAIDKAWDTPERRAEEASKDVVRESADRAFIEDVAKDLK